MQYTEFYVQWAEKEKCELQRDLSTEKIFSGQGLNFLAYKLLLFLGLW